MAWYNASWLYRLPVTVTNGSSTSALAYAQVPIALTGAAYTSFHAHALANGADIIVTAADGVTTLSFALEEIDTVNSVVYLLVKVPAVAPSGSTTVYVYYGNAGATSASSYPNTVGTGTALVGPNDVMNQSSGLPNTGIFNTGCVVLSNGNIVVLAWDDTSNGGYQGSIGQATSTNGGTSWAVRTIATPAASNGFVPRSIGLDSSGNILLHYTYGLTSAQSMAPAYCAKSTNGGVTWSNLSTSPSNPLPAWPGGSTIFALYGPIITDAAGNLYVCGYGILSGTYTEYLFTCPAASDPTVGSNWVVQGTIASSSTNLWTETAICFTNPATGAMFAVLRNDVTAGTGNFNIAYSTNYGVTWGAASPMNIPGTVSATYDGVSPWVIKLASGNYLLAWGIRYPAPATPANWGVGCALSTDSGVTWLDRPIAMPAAYSNASPNLPPGIGYPSLTQLANSTIFMSYYYQGGATDAIVNVAGEIFTEDYICNINNYYDACQSLGAAWTNLGGNVTVSPTHTLNGAANALKFDNSAATGGHADLQINNQNTTLITGSFAVTLWRYDSQISSTQANAIVLLQTTLSPRAQISTLGSNGHIEWYNGSAYTDTGFIPALNQWNRHTIHARAPAGSVAGMIQLNDNTPYASLGQSGAGTVPTIVHALAGSAGSVNACTFWLGTLFTHQFLPAEPTLAVGGEQTNVASAIVGRRSLYKKVGSRGIA